MRGVLGFLLSLWLLGAIAPLYGQEIRGSIVGNVTDSTGAAVPGTQITVKNEGTGIESKTRTDASGTYTVPDLLAGVYAVIAVKGGFRPIKLPEFDSSRRRLLGRMCYCKWGQLRRR
jgi:hypothetical protein